MPRKKSTDEAVPACIVVVGSSAGGVDALLTLVATLEADFPAPIVLAQHLEPHRSSELAALLARRTRLRVVETADADTLAAGTIHVIPAGHSGRIEGGAIRLDRDGAHRSQPSVDLLFTTAAAAYGDYCFAVILSGTGSDGVAGAIEVKARGGTVLIQSPAAARFPQMARALPPTAVDHEAELERIGPLLSELLAAVRRERTAEGDAAVAAIVALLEQRTGVDFAQYKRPTILRRIARRMAMTYCATFADYAKHLETDPNEPSELLRTILIRVTAFFRDGEAFEFLYKTVLPDVIATARARDKELRIWSAGCSTGEEAYSIAFLVADLLGAELRDWTVKVFATDLEESAIQFARRGLYPVQKLPPGYLGRYFEPSEGGYRVRKSIRELVIFGQQDLTRGVPFPRIDLAICRNLLIYLKPELQEAVLDLLAYSLRAKQGYLFLGKAETVLPSDTAFELVQKRWKVYRRRPDTGVLEPRRARYATLPSGGERRGERHAPGPPVAARDPRFDAMLALRRLNESLLRQLPVGIAILDSSYRVVLMNAAARRLLGVREVAAEQDFLHAARGLPYREMRGIIDAAIRDHSTGSIDELELADDGGAARAFVSVGATHVQLETDGESYVLLSISDVTPAVQLRRQLQAVQAEQGQLVAELGGANRRLEHLNRELQDANQELQSSNEELMLAHEELQAVNEEFEATNEELQATNEELETNNEELQATNEELEATNEELNARTNDLQESAKRLEHERFRLAEMVELAPASILVLRGASLRVEHVNSRFAQLLGERDAIGQPIADVADTPQLQLVADLARRCWRENATIASGPVEVTRADAPERWLEYTAVPSHEHDSAAIAGVVMYAEDVTDAVARRERERDDYLKLMVEHVRQAALGLYAGSDRTLLQANRPYRELLRATGRSPIKGAIGRRWAELAFECDGDVDDVLDAVARDGHFVCPTPLETTDGRVWEWSIGAIRGAEAGTGGSEPQYYLLCAIEVTAQVRAREALERIDRHKDEFLSLASHELRTPLVPLVAYSDMLERLLRDQPGSDWQPRALENVGRVRRELQRMVRLTDDLLDVARVQTGKLSLARGTVDLERAVSAVVDGARASRGIEIRVESPPEPLVVDGDEQRLQQVFGNLVDNAIKFGGGAPIEVRLAKLDGHAVVEVADAGPGIPPEHAGRVFDRFFQVEGTASNGLGLYITRSIIESHGGEIGLDSVPGKGATFRVSIPLASPDGRRRKPEAE